MIEVKLGQVWYFMMYLSDNDTLKFWGWINMMINSSSFILVFLSIAVLISFICIYFFNSFGIRKINGFFIGIILSLFVFFNVIVKQSSDLTRYSIEIANNLYLVDKSKYDGYETWSNKYFQHK